MKVDLWIKFLLYISAFILVPIVFFVPEDEVVIVAIVMVFNMALVLPLVLVGYYEIRDKELYLRIGFFSKKIPLDVIERVHEVRGFTSNNSFALSTDRLRIEFKKRINFMKYTEVSPEDKERFIMELNRRINQEEL